MDLFLTNIQLFTSKNINVCVNYSFNVEKYFSYETILAVKQLYRELWCNLA